MPAPGRHPDRFARPLTLALACLAALALAAAAAASSQPAPAAPATTPRLAATAPTHSWLSLAMGFGSVEGGIGDTDGGFTADASIAYRKGMSLYTLRGCTVTEMAILGGGPGWQPASIWDVGAMYGLVAKGTYGLASASAGLGVVGLATDTGLLSERVTTLCPGIPMEAQLVWTPTPWVGLGLHGFADLNGKKSFSGVLLSLEVGRLQ